MFGLRAAIACSIALLAAPSTSRRRALAGLEGRLDHQCPGREQMGFRWYAESILALDLFQATPSMPFGVGAAKDAYGFADYSVGHTLGIGQEYGLGNIQATLGVRLAEPLVSNGFTPSFDPRRYLGSGPRVGFEGNSPLASSWVIEWQVGAALLSGNRTFDTNGVAIRCCRISSSGSVLSVDGLLGLSYWFDTASKLTLGYHADYFKGSTALTMTGATAENADRVNHGPMIRFSIQK